MKLSVEVLSLLRMKGTLAPTYWSSIPFQSCWGEFPVMTPEQIFQIDFKAESMPFIILLNLNRRQKSV